MGNAQPQQPFTILNERQLLGLTECGASGREWAAYATLARYHDAAGTCNANAAGSGLALGIDAKAFTRAVLGLTKKTFTARDGSARPVLVRKQTRAHKGRNARYIDALYLDSLEPAEDAKGNESVPLTNPKGYEMVPKGVRNGSQRGTNRYPDKNKEERKIFSAEDAATQAPRADLAAEGPTPGRGTGEGSHDAPTMEPPTLAEWQRLESLLQYGPLSPTDEARRAAGAARYIPAPPRPAPRREGAA